MYRLYQILFVFLLFFASCEDNNDVPDAKGNITISSEIFGTNLYYVNGYSFEEDKFVPSLNSGGSVPDIIPVNVLLVSGDVTGMILSASEDGSGLYKNFESSNIKEAEGFFNNYRMVDAANFTSLSDTLETGQVYTFKTYKDNYVKFLVEDVRLMSGSLLKDYVEADIKYYIQRDGSQEFDE